MRSFDHGQYEPGCGSLESIKMSSPENDMSVYVVDTNRSSSWSGCYLKYGPPVCIWCIAVT